MDRTIRLGIIAGIIVTWALIGIIYLFQPSVISQENTVKPRVVNAQAHISLEKEKVFIKQDPVISTSLPTQIELIQQRDQLYRDFEAISQSLSVGQQPDFRQVSDLLDKQQQLVKAGGLSANDAISYCQFLRQILPDMDHQINQHILKLEQFKYSTS
ncbi:hypothetical protein AY606_02305 [Acinetobacter sp. SFB]|uniref:hypothetical protein n=1 Tax=Acinetobacter sp. SFB TaxID=1805634 RepID=UPI0007D7DB6B|nr:hypothetical protein [Acinetobacter sp. SFB]OAL81584.1 hypothetical protein AY606_02305 [Acinetobacter sp. SFB]